jgi:hypothetical protein
LQANYLGDTGICTNIAGVTGSIARLSVRVPARTALVVDVEGCSVGQLDLRYVPFKPGSQLVEYRLMQVDNFSERQVAHQARRRYNSSFFRSTRSVAAIRRS